jgi:hypothetical protein
MPVPCNSNEVTSSQKTNTWCGKEERKKTND